MIIFKHSSTSHLLSWTFIGSTQIKYSRISLYCYLLSQSPHDIRNNNCQESCSVAWFFPTHTEIMEISDRESSVKLHMLWGTAIVTLEVGSIYGTDLDWRYKFNERILQAAGTPGTKVMIHHGADISLGGWDSISCLHHLEVLSHRLCVGNISKILMAAVLGQAAANWEVMYLDSQWYIDPLTHFELQWRRRNSRP